MTNILVEGGPHVLGSFFKARLVDEVMVFIAPKLVGEGVSAVAGWAVRRMRAAVSLDNVRFEKSGKDVLITGAVSYPAPR